MNVTQTQWTKTAGWTPTPPAASGAQLVLVFGAKALLADAEWMAAVNHCHPGARLIGCSTAGEICGTRVSDDSVVVTAVTFEHTQLAEACVRLGPVADSFAAGQTLAQAIPHSVPSGIPGQAEPLAHVLVLSDGHNVNGSDLVRGLTQHLPAGITVTGGLAGDGVAFGETLVFADRAPQARTITALGLYGRRLKVGFGSLGGWDSFGPERLITRSKGNVLYELDGQSALGLYKKYLGDHARELPASGLLFPLNVRIGAAASPVVRTILAVDEAEQSLTFAGDVPEGSYARLMKANFDRLIDGASGAARTSYQALGDAKAELAILISCVGRKLVLGQRVEEEVEGVAEVFGPQAVLTGFYSYGELAPFTAGDPCALHNQTMTITTFAEA